MREGPIHIRQLWTGETPGLTTLLRPLRRRKTTLESRSGQLKSISRRCHLFEVAFVWELAKATIHLLLSCLQGEEGYWKVPAFCLARRARTSFRANVERIRRSRPDSGLDFTAKVLTFQDIQKGTCVLPGEARAHEVEGRSGKEGIELKLSGNEVYCTACSLLVI